MTSKTLNLFSNSKSVIFLRTKDIFENNTVMHKKKLFCNVVFQWIGKCRT